jgi:DNA-binding response OmpR family regulator
MNNYLMLIDDDISICPLYKTVLEQHGFRVDWAETAQQALDLISKTGMPDILVLDFSMPLMNGEQFMDEINKNYDRTHTRIIGFSSTDHDNPMIRGFRHKVDSYGEKPNSVEALLRTIFLAKKLPAISLGL